MAVGARILYDVLEYRFDFRNYLHFGYYFTDGLWGGPLAYLMVAVPFALLYGDDRRKLLDFTVLTLPLPMILAKIACFVNGCCYGLPCAWPWCLASVEGADAQAGIPRHPTQLYEIVVLAVILLVFGLLDRRRWQGMLVFWFLLLYGLGRPLTEVFRMPDIRRPTAGSLTTSQAVCLAGALIAAAVLLLSERHRHKDPPPALATP
jgi:phosphatidylglycerol:prolipoprotein diacylglycerol transferase